MKIQSKLYLFLKPIIVWIETLYTANIKESDDVKGDDDDGDDDDDDDDSDDDDDGENDDNYDDDDDIWWCTFRLGTNEQVIPQGFLIALKPPNI